MSEAVQQKITLCANDGEVMTIGKSTPLSSNQPSAKAATNKPIDKDVAIRSMLIKNMMEDLGGEALTQTVPIPNVSCPASSHPLRPTFC